MHLQWEYAYLTDDADLSSDARQRVGVNGPPIGNHPLRMVWSGDR